jgi:hypothetical protein
MKWNPKGVKCDGSCGFVQRCVQTSRETFEHVLGYITDKSELTAAKRLKKGTREGGLAGPTEPIQLNE